MACIHFLDSFCYIKVMRLTPNHWRLIFSQLLVFVGALTITAEIVSFFHYSTGFSTAPSPFNPYFLWKEIVVSDFFIVRRWPLFLFLIFICVGEGFVRKWWPAIWRKIERLDLQDPEEREPPL